MAAGASRARIWAALVAVYVIWGSTYLGILLAIRTIPVFLMVGIRFLVGGTLLYAWSIRRGDRAGDRPGLRQWRAAAIVGIALLFLGNGSLAWAEKRVDTGVSSLVIATVPLWMALFDRLVWGQRLSRRGALGIAVGLAGAALLASPAGADHLNLLGTLALLVSALSWATGSLWSRRAPLPKRPLVAASMEMLVAGAALTLAGVASGEPARVHHVSTQSLLALVYLIAVGSLVGFTAYAWLLRAAPTALVSTYAYVNPAVAVFLGWAIESEPITARTLVAGGMILVAVALIFGARVPARKTALASARALPARGR